MPNPKLPVSENWRWPDGTTPRLEVGPATTPPAYVGEALEHQETILQLRRDRDELLAALVEEHANSAPIAPCYEPCSPISSCRVCTLLARVKGR